MNDLRLTILTETLECNGNTLQYNNPLTVSQARWLVDNNYIKCSSTPLSTLGGDYFLVNPQLTETGIELRNKLRHPILSTVKPIISEGISDSIKHVMVTLAGLALVALITYLSKPNWFTNF